jgi:DNA-directed RNA polymerase specialized sigma24 family protein
MTGPDSHAVIDSLAERCVLEKDEKHCEPLIEELLFQHCACLIKTIAGTRLRGSTLMTQDIEDVCNDALLELVAKLDQLRSGAAQAVASFSRYTAVVAYHACHDYFRRKFPRRHCLKNRLRYLLKPQRGFDLWESANGDWICGFEKWRDTPARGTPRSPDGAARLSPPDLLAAIFKLTGGPVEFDALVDLVAELWSVKDQQIGLHLVESVPSPARPADNSAVRATVLAAWKEIGELPRAQRFALLLNLRAEGEQCALELFLLTGIASMREIAAVLDIPAEEFARMWNRLPLDDQWIAERLQVTRQQVINLRKSARKRLERRMAIKPEKSTSFMTKLFVCLCHI